MNAQEEARKKDEERKKKQGSADLSLRGLRLDQSYSSRCAYTNGADFRFLAMVPRERVFRDERGATNVPLRVNDWPREFAFGFENGNLRKNCACLYLCFAADFGCKTVPGVSGVRRRRPICAEAGRQLPSLWGR